MPINVRENVLVADPKTLAERQKVAREFAAQFRFTLPILVDNIADDAEQIFAAWPDRIYVLDAEGRVAYKGGPGPRGFDVGAARTALERLLTLPEGLPVVSAEQRRLLRERLATEGLAAPAVDAVLVLLDRRLAAYAALETARKKLLDSARPSPVTDYEAELKRYLETVARLDAELETETGYRGRPRVHALLLGLGIVGPRTAMPDLSPLDAPGK